MGYPVTQPVKVAFDTGSEFLAITSTLCDDDTTPQEFQFKKVDQASGKEVVRNETQKKNRCLSKAFAPQNSTEFHLIKDKSSIVSYGSAQLQGFLS